MPVASAAASAASMRLDGEFTIYRVAELKRSLIGALQTAPRLEIDLAGITEIDTSGLQLLMLLKREAATQGRTLTLANHSQAVVEAFDLLDLAPFFGDPIVTDGAKQ